MTNKSLIQLTTKLYRLTLRFPKKEPLRYKMREVADDILASIVSLEVFCSSRLRGFSAVDRKEREEVLFAFEKDIEILNSYFEVTKWQNWVDYFDVLEMQEDYGTVKNTLSEAMKGLAVDEEAVPPAQPEERTKLPSIEQYPRKEEHAQEKEIALGPRKGRILEILGNVEQVQVGELNRLLPDVSKRTLRRDFQQLLEYGFVEKIGEKNNTFYRLHR